MASFESTVSGAVLDGHVQRQTRDEREGLGSPCDDLNRVLTDNNELGSRRSFVYDALGNLTERTDRNGYIREFDYDLLSRLAAKEVPWL